MCISQNRRRIKKITLVSILIPIALILTIISRYSTLPFFASFLKLDLSVFIFAIIINILGFYYGIVSVVIVGIFSFFLQAYQSWIGLVVNIFSNLSYIMIFFALNISFIKSQKNKSQKNSNAKIIVALVLSTVFISLVLAILNGFFFTPLYWWNSGYIKYPLFLLAEERYNSGVISPIFFGISNYWEGIFVTFVSFNLIKFGIASMIIFFVLLWIKNNNIAFNYFRC